MMEKELIEKLFGKNNVIVQPRRDFHVVYPFTTYEEGVNILFNLSYNNTTTLVYYNGVVQSTTDFVKNNGGK